jgi:hypothetical protein
MSATLPLGVGVVALPSVMKAAEPLTDVVRGVSKDKIHLGVPDDCVQELKGVSVHHCDPVRLVLEL